MSTFNAKKAYLVAVAANEARELISPAVFEYIKSQAEKGLFSAIFFPEEDFGIDCNSGILPENAMKRLDLVKRQFESLNYSVEYNTDIDMTYTRSVKSITITW
ncbi:hypothetical protein fHeYen901_239 [Yersinia phage fHe-Yen9-01]|uniref:Uncharacterized protein n=1 Tax=Yersinia phage fHe-Yen9-01 TaxID=1965363 RepID=A0A1V0DXY0_9CAUD|nr:hypothetical protein KNT60_gp238 [Yersinia phage fHe-Yen9-01]ARB06012.1 hypothetical protein fHeYen901_239 [Yersinia phage fHe-Yen9-01]